MATPASGPVTLGIPAAAKGGGSQWMGIGVGLIMYFVLEPLILWYFFQPWIVNPSKRKSPPPDFYLHAAMYSFFAMVLTAVVLTKTFSTIDEANTPLMQWFGYNNICVYFDTAPSIYICPIYWFTVACLVVSFVKEDSKRVHHLAHVGRWHKRLALAGNVAFAIVAAAFSLCLAIPPEDDMIMHT